MTRQIKDKNKVRIQGKFRITEYEVGTKKIKSQTGWYKNLITEASGYGLNIIMQHLFGNNASPLEIFKARIGTGTTAPAVTDTDLETPLAYDIQIADSVLTDETTLDIQFFAPDAFIPLDTYGEFGTYVGTSGSPKLFSRALISPTYTKGGSADITIDYTFTIANV